MITLIRWIILQQKKIKYQLAVYMFIDKLVKDGTANEMFEKFQKEIIKELAPIIHEQAVKEREKENTSEFAEK